MNLKKGIFNITGEDMSIAGPFVTGVIKMITKIPGTKCMVLDASEILGEDIPNGIEVDTGDCSTGIDKIMNLPDSSTPTVCVITGIGDLLSKMDISKKGEFTDKNIEEAKKNIISTINFIPEEQDTELIYYFSQELSGYEMEYKVLLIFYFS